MVDVNRNIYIVVLHYCYMENKEKKQIRQEFLLDEKSPVTHKLLEACDDPFGGFK